MLKTQRASLFFFSFSLVLATGCKVQVPTTTLNQDPIPPSTQEPTTTSKREPIVTSMSMSMSNSTTEAGAREKILISLLDQQGGPINVLENTTVNLGQTGTAKFYLASAPSAGEMNVNQVVIPKGKNSVEVYVSGTASGRLSITSEISGMVGMSVSWQILPAVPVKIETAAKVQVVAGVCETLDFRVLDRFGNLSPIRTSFLASLGGSGDFFSESDCRASSKLEEGKLNLASGTSVGKVYYKNSSANSTSITLDDVPNKGLEMGISNVSTIAASPKSVVFKVPSEVKAGVCNPGEFIIVDQFGNPSPLPDNTKVKLAITNLSTGADAGIFPSQNCSDTNAYYDVTFNANSKATRGLFGFVATGAGGSFKFNISEVGTAVKLTSSEKSINILSSCGPASTPNFSAWNISQDDMGKTLIQGNANAGTIYIGYTQSGNIFVMDKTPADDPTGASAIILRCSQSIEIHTGIGPKNVRVELGYVTNLPSAARFERNISIYSESTTGTSYIYGSEFDDVIYDSPGNDVIVGRGGRDTIFVQKGGSDVVYGGAGNDQIFVGTSTGTPPQFGTITAYGGSGADSFLIQNFLATGLVSINGDGPDLP